MKSILWVFVLGAYSFACSTFQLAGENGVYFGKNFDWNQNHGALIFNPTGLRKTAVVRGEPAVWTSRYASLTFNQPGLGFPQGGINEKGLVIEVMVGPEEYPKNSSLPKINELQWLQRILDISATTDEAVAAASLVTIEKLHITLHYLICDSTRNCAAIEHLHGRPVIHEGIEYPIFTNDEYDRMISALKLYEGFGGFKKLPSGFESSERFARLAGRIQNYHNEEPFSYAFSMLDSVAIGPQWQTVYEQTRREVHFRNPKIGKMQVFQFPTLQSYSCGQGWKAIDLESKNSVTAFSDFSTEWNDSLVDKTLNIPLQLRKILKAYPSTEECTDGSRLGTL